MAKQITALNDETFQQATAKGVVLVDFHATWCGPCRMLAPIVASFADKMNGKVEVVSVDIDEAQQITASLGITSVPTLILFVNGKEAKRVVGVKDLEYLLDLVKPHVH